MKARLVILSIDDIVRLFRDYTAMTGFPEDGVADTLLFNPTTNEMCLRISADSLSGREKPEQVRFDLKQTFMVS